MELSEEAYNLLCCRKCNMLNFPLYQTGENENLICGKCYSPDGNENIAKQTQLEKMIKTCCVMKCPYKECLYWSSWEKMQEHMESCEKVETPCPFDCTFNGNCNEMIAHYENEHSEHVLKSTTLELNKT